MQGVTVTTAGVRLKPGCECLDPVGRVVTILSVSADRRDVQVRLAGAYGATVLYPASVLRPVEES